MIYPRIILGFSLLLFTVYISAQKKAELEKSRTQIQNEIETTSKYLKSTDKQITVNLENYYLLEAQISNRKSLISNMGEEILTAENRIIAIKKQIDSLDNVNTKLNIAYKKILRKKYVNKLSSNSILNYFSVQSVEEAYKKWIYSNQYKGFLETQKKLLSQNQMALDSAYDFQHDQAIQKQEFIQLKQDETSKLNIELRKKDLLLANLEKKQANLKIDLLSQKKKQKEIQKEIERVILAEMERQRNAAKLEEENTEVLTGDFIQYKGNLSAPVKHAVIIGRYGKQAHPTNAGLVIQNNGIDFKTSSGEKVEAIFQGQVVGSTFISGVGHMVIVRHGNYYSVYSKLTQVNVQVGDPVKRHQQLGIIDELLHFEIWLGKEKQNPSNWIK